ncbi:NAD(P)H-binding [Janthinobacterium sp. TND4EL3]|uniref:NAD(P)H-binding protein n=1 Tax=Janthinobacterium sp. TND4EL3 TaxID=1907311 RepID=UPI000956CDD3|nr:NAD(P)H-binding protein [Janthinobacterium sp. TND4EL3]SIR62070.1 NAD(P)H-binding [Janthinobacterium sp. TND4EL3]
MKNILILGANGQLARNATARFLEVGSDEHVNLKLYLRRASRLVNPDPRRVSVVEGDVCNARKLQAAMQGIDVVFASLSGEMATQAQHIVSAMNAAGVRRLIFISSMGIYGEVPGQPYRSVLDPYRDSAAVVERSDLEYTVLRPGWFTHDADIGYQITQKGQPFIGHDISLDSLSTLIVKLATSDGLYLRCSLGVSSDH